MIHSRLGRIAASALLAGTAFAAFSGAPAGAATPGIACKQLTGSIAGNITFKKCTGNTGGASMPLPASQLTKGGTVTWKNTKTTTITLAVVAGDASKCKAGSAEYEANGKTKSDTTGSAKIKGKVHASVCVAGSGTVSLVKGTLATIA
jgi:hypothetical protein